MTAPRMPARPDAPPGNARVPLAVMLLALATLLVGVADHALWTPDEPREAELVRSFARPGACRLYPLLAGKPFVEKPPLFYWGAALSLRALGPLLGAAGATRAASALCALLTALLTWAVARRFLGPARGAASAAVLLTTAGFFHSGHWIITDPALMAAVAAALLLGFWGEEVNRPVLVLAAFACAGLSFLAKGLIGPALIAPPALAIAAIHRREMSGRKALHIAGFAVAALVVLGWAAPFRICSPPEAWRAWFWDNQVGRFLGRTHELGHIRGPFYYLPVLPLMLLPWTPVLLGAAGRRFAGEAEVGGAGRRFLLMTWAWAAGGLFLLSLAGTKRDIYLHPLLPAFAIIAGAAGIGRQPRWVGVCLSVFNWLMVSALLAAGLVGADWTGGRLEWGLGLQPWALVAAAAALWILLGIRWPALPRTACIAAVFYLGAVKTLVPLVDKAKDYEPGTRAILSALPPGAAGVACGWDLDETCRGLLGYYGELSVPDLCVDTPEAERSAVLKDALAGRNGRCRYLIAMSKRHPFPPPGVELEPGRIRAVGRLGAGRTLYLVECARPAAR